MFEALESREFMSATTTLSATQPADSTSTATISYPKSPTTVQPSPTPQVIISIIGVLVG
jgi:hypothetical protein